MSGGGGGCLCAAGRRAVRCRGRRGLRGRGASLTRGSSFWVGCHRCETRGGGRSIRGIAEGSAAPRT